MRTIDLLKGTLENIEQLEAEFRDSLDSELGQTSRSVEIKNRIDALRIYVCTEIKSSIKRGEHKKMKQLKAV